jgi:RES domain-containing protein
VELDGLPVIREAFARSIRLVTTARLRDAALLPLVENPQDLDALAEIEGATSNRLIAQQRGTGEVAKLELVYGVPFASFINASFAYAKPRQLSRFSGPGRGAWYSALEVETALAEVAFHMTRFLADAGRLETSVDYAELWASFAGEFVDLRNPRLNHQCLDADPATAYPAGNRLARSAIESGINGIVYPSVRRKGGTCIAALFPHAVQSVAQGGIWRLAWKGNENPEITEIAPVLSAPQAP